MKTKLTTCLAMLICVAIGRSQGFANLDFEAATIISPQGIPNYALASAAIPGWTATPLNGLNGNTYIFYDGLSAGGAAVDIEDTESPYFTPLQGQYSIDIVGDYNPGSSSGRTAEISQTGLIPIGTQSLIFWGNLTGIGIDLLLNGQNTPYAAIGSGSGYTIYQANISGYAGQSTTLGLFAPVNGGALLDNIQFSSSPVPEPGIFALTVLGGLFLTCHRYRKLA